MTKKLYDIDSHLKEFDATVLSCIKKEDFYLIELDQTAFFAEGGGQDSDTGFLNDVEVLYVCEENHILYHKTKLPLDINTSIHGVINWAERFSNMQNHSGEHIVSGIIHKDYGYNNIGFHMGKDAITIDFDGLLTLEDLKIIEQKANAAIYQNLEIIATYPEADALKSLDYRSKIEIDGAVRIVEIPGIDMCACCAPHVKFTGEIGLIKLLSMEKYKSGVRISMLCGKRAFEDYQLKQTLVTAISQELSAKSENVAEAVSKLKAENYAINGKVISLTDTLIAYKLDALSPTTENIFLFEKGLDKNSIRKIVNGLMEKSDKICGVFNETADTQNIPSFTYVIGSKTIDVRDFSKQLNAALEGRGGGSLQMTQGSLNCSLEQLKDFLKC